MRSDLDRTRTSPVARRHQTDHTPSEVTHRLHVDHEHRLGLPPWCSSRSMAHASLTEVFGVAFLFFAGAFLSGALIAVLILSVRWGLWVWLG